MTIRESTICSLIQSFPVLLILAQNHNKCLKTPLIYKPPTPTPSPEYYEALDALFHNLFGHGYHDGHHGGHYPDCLYGHTYSYDKKYTPTTHAASPCTPSYGHQTPTHGYQYPSYGHHGQGTSYGYQIHTGTHGYPTYGLKRVNVYNMSVPGYKGYAPGQVYTVNHKYKVVVKRGKKGGHRRAQKITDETCDTVDGEIGSCLSILECEPYVELLKQSRSNPAVVQTLRKAHCGFEGNNPKVCCPRPGIPMSSPQPPVTSPSTSAPAPTPSHSDYTASFLEPPVCGLSNASFSRVIGGVDAALGDFPWMALLGYKSRGGGVSWLCGGSLVSSRHVLTAAHCIHGHEKDLYLVRLGELDLSREDEGAFPIDVVIKKQVMHEGYDSKALTNDIALLLLEKDVQFTDLIRPICIPKTSELRALTFEDYNPIIAGWGDTQFRGPSASHLQVLQLPVVSNEFCAQAFSAYKAQVIDQRVLCAGYKKGGKDACQGDSGGPLMQPIWNKSDFKTFFYQIGVVSYGKKCAEPGFPGVYTRVTQFVPWLEKNMLGAA